MCYALLMKTRWRHDMETHKAWLPLCEEIHHSPMVSSHAGSSMFWCFLFCLFKQVVKQTIELPVIWDAMMLIWRHCNVHDLCKTLVLYFQVVWSNVQQLVKHKTFRLLIPLMIFNGFEQGFVYADFNKVTRNMAKCRYITETEMSFWRNFHHWLHFNNIQCDQWWQFHQNDIFVSVWYRMILTNWGRVTHICVCKLIVTGSDSGLSPGQRQAIIWTNAGILLIVSSGTKFSEILIKILRFPFQKMHLKCRLRNGHRFVSALMC